MGVGGLGPKWRVRGIAVAASLCPLYLEASLPATALYGAGSRPLFFMFTTTQQQQGLTQSGSVVWRKERNGSVGKIRNG